VRTQLRCDICKETGVQLGNEHWYEHVLKLVKTSDEGTVTVLRNEQVQTSRTVHNNKPDIIMPDNEKGTCCNFRRQKCGQERH
jgi:hypothetical protein